MGPWFSMLSDALLVMGQEVLNLVKALLIHYRVVLALMKAPIMPCLPQIKRVFKHIGQILLGKRTASPRVATSRLINRLCNASLLHKIAQGTN